MRYGSVREQLEANFEPVPEAGCWIWTACRTAQGYGHVWVNHKRYIATRLAWEVYRGPIPPGICVCHKCDTPSCVNPDHLFLGTNADNMRDMERKGRRRSAAGEKNGRARLTREQAMAIRESSLSRNDLAAMYGVHPKHVYRIKTGRFWKAEAVQ